MSTFSEPDLRQLDCKLQGVTVTERVKLAELALDQLRQQPAVVTVKRATNLQMALVESRLFEPAKKIAETLFEVGLNSSLLGKLAVQSYIECGQLARAECEIERLLGIFDLADPQHLELQGLSGRIAKQRYMNGSLAGTPQDQDLCIAIDRYLDAYDNNPQHPIWHGINAAALLERAKRDKICRDSPQRSHQIANDIFARINTSLPFGELSFWEYATASEAALVLGNYEASELWLHRYLSHPDIPLFAVASTLRQYREVWQMSQRTLPGSVLLPLLDRKLASYGQMQMPIESARSKAYEGEFEKVFGKASFISYAKYLLGAERAKSVARVEDKSGDPKGTGFLMRGSDLGPRFDAHQMVLLTNAHVINENDPEAALHPNDACCTFYGVTQSRSGLPQKASIDKVLWSSPSSQLDTTIVSLSVPIQGVEPCPMSRAMPKPGPDSKVFIVGYPGGGGLSFSLFDSELLEYETTGPRVRYRTPTEPGSSGSPVFNQNWELIAIHHSGAVDMQKLDGSGAYEANEGMKIHAVRQAVNS